MARNDILEAGVGRRRFCLLVQTARVMQHPLSHPKSQMLRPVQGSCGNPCHPAKSWAGVTPIQRPLRNELRLVGQRKRYNSHGPKHSLWAVEERHAQHCISRQGLSTRHRCSPAAPRYLSLARAWRQDSVSVSLSHSKQHHASLKPKRPLVHHLTPSIQRSQSTQTWSFIILCKPGSIKVRLRWKKATSRSQASHLSFPWDLWDQSQMSWLPAPSHSFAALQNAEDLEQAKPISHNCRCCKTAYPNRAGKQPRDIKGTELLGKVITDFEPQNLVER